MKWCLWVAGKFSLTNEMLSNKQAFGFAKGRRVYRPVDHYTEEKQAIGLAVAGAARVQNLPLLPPMASWRIACIVLGHRRHDTDAWYLLAKAAIDGLKDCDRLLSDLWSVAWVGGAVLHSPEGERDAIATAYGHGYMPSARDLVLPMQGFFLMGQRAT